MSVGVERFIREHEAVTNCKAVTCKSSPCTPRGQQDHYQELLYNWGSKESRFYRDQNDQVGHRSTLSPIWARAPPKTGSWRKAVPEPPLSPAIVSEHEGNGTPGRTRKNYQINGLDTGKIPGMGPFKDFSGSIKRAWRAGVSGFRRRKRWAPDAAGASGSRWNQLFDSIKERKTPSVRPRPARPIHIIKVSRPR